MAQLAEPKSGCAGRYSICLQGVYEESFRTDMITVPSLSPETVCATSTPYGQPAAATA